jgi:hypothetical protein
VVFLSSITIPAGTTWAYGWPIYDENNSLVDLTGWSARAQVRPNRWVGGLGVLHEWSSADPPANITLTNSTVTIHVDADESSEWDWYVGAFQIKLTDTENRVARIDDFDMRVTPDGVYG